jgi:hypothetical protein
MGALRSQPCLSLLAALALATQALPAQASEPDAAVSVSFAGPPTRQGAMISLPVSLASRTPGKVRVQLVLSAAGGDGAASAPVTVLVDPSAPLTLTAPVPASGDLMASLSASPEEGGPPGLALEYLTAQKTGGAYQPLSASDYLIRNSRLRAKTSPVFGMKTLTSKSIAPMAAAGGMGVREAGKPEPRFIVSGGRLLDSAGQPMAQAPKTPPRPGRNKAKAAALDQPLAVTGRITTRVNGVTVPMANTEIQVWDYDRLTPDDLLGKTTTDANGAYSITVTNDDGPGGGGVDIYLLITSYRPVVNQYMLIPDGEGSYFPSYYAWRSTTTDDITTPSVAINFQITENAPAASVWSGASSAYYLASTATSIPVRSWDVRYPGFVPGTFFNGAVINIDAANNSPVVVGHEYGHAVMYQAYGGQMGPGGTHYFCQPASTGLAWSEGFATFFGLAAIGSPDGQMHWSVGDEGVSMENWSCNIHDLNTDEGRVAAALWDLYDAPDDNNGGSADRGRNGFSDANSANRVGIRTMLDTLLVRRQTTATEYWTDLKARLTAAQSPGATQIISYNYGVP